MSFRRCILVFFMGVNAFTDLNERQICLCLTCLFDGLSMLGCMASQEYPQGALMGVVLSLSVICLSVLSGGRIGCGDGLVLLGLSFHLTGPAMLFLFSCTVLCCSLLAAVLLAGRAVKKAGAGKAAAGKAAAGKTGASERKDAEGAEKDNETGEMSLPFVTVLFFCYLFCMAAGEGM